MINFLSYSSFIISLFIIINYCLSFFLNQTDFINSGQEHKILTITEHLVLQYYSRS